MAIEEIPEVVEKIKKKERKDSDRKYFSEIKDKIETKKDTGPKIDSVTENGSELNAKSKAKTDSKRMKDSENKKGSKTNDSSNPITPAHIENYVSSENKSKNWKTKLISHTFLMFQSVLSETVAIDHMSYHLSNMYLMYTDFF